MKESSLNPGHQNGQHSEIEPLAIPQGPAAASTRMHRSQRSIPAAAPVFVLAISLLLTAIATGYVAYTGRQRERLNFASRVRQTTDTLSSRFDTYLSLLRGANGLFSSKPNLTAHDFHEYVDRLEIEKHYPGIRAIGFVLRVQSGTEARITATRRAEGADQYHLWPAQQTGSFRTAILYLEPNISKNATGYGYDQMADPDRKPALDLACDSGQPAATGRVLLLQKDKEERQPGFLVYLPVYTSGTAPKSPELRRSQLFGYVYCTFRSMDLLRTVLGESDKDDAISLRAFDGDGFGPDDLLYASDAQPRQSGLSHTDLATTVRLPVAGRSWLLLFSPSAGFEHGDTDLTWWTLISGILISTLLFAITLALARARDTAEDSAVRLLKSEEALRDNELHQRTFFRDVLASVTEGRLRLCESELELPVLLAPLAEVRLERPTLRRLRNAVREAAVEAGIGDERTHDLVTATGEASMNAVVHAGGGIGTVALSRDGMVQIVIRDSGAGIDMRRLPRATLERGYTTAGSLGHGFFLMLNSVDRVWLLTNTAGTCVVLEQDATAADPAWLTERMGSMPAQTAAEPASV